MKMLNLNSANPTARRPIRVSDLQDIWAALQGMLSLGETSPKILCGFELPSILNPNEPVGSGVIAFRGQLYLYDADVTPLTVGSDVVFHRGVSSGDLRTLSDQTIIPFSFENTITGASISTDVDVYRWAFTRANIEEARTPFIGTRAVTRNNLAKPFADIIPSAITTGNPETLDNVITWGGGSWLVLPIVASGADANLRLSLTHADTANLPNQFFTTFRSPMGDCTLSIVSTLFDTSYLRTVSITPLQTAVLTFSRLGNRVALTGVMLAETT